MQDAVYRFIRSLGLAAVLGALLAFAGSPAQAASACKGLARAQCEGAGSCAWVKGYATRKGTRVSAHCRSKPKKSGGKAASHKAIKKQSGSTSKTSGMNTKKKAGASGKKAGMGAKRTSASHGTKSRKDKK